MDGRRGCFEPHEVSRGMETHQAWLGHLECQHGHYWIFERLRIFICVYQRQMPGLGVKLTGAAGGGARLLCTNGQGQG